MRWALFATAAAAGLPASVASAQINQGQTARTQVQWQGTPPTGSPRVTSSFSASSVAQALPSPQHSFVTGAVSNQMSFMSDVLARSQPYQGPGTGDEGLATMRSRSALSLTNANVQAASFTATSTSIWADVISISGLSVSTVSVTFRFELTGEMTRSDSSGRAQSRVLVTGGAFSGTPTTLLNTSLTGDELARTYVALEIPYTTTIAVNGPGTQVAMSLVSTASFNTAGVLGSSGSASSNFADDLQMTPRGESQGSLGGLRLRASEVRGPDQQIIPWPEFAITSGSGRNYAPLIPTPGSTALLVLGGVIAARRRR
jgi:hypothetical protein